MAGGPSPLNPNVIAGKKKKKEQDYTAGRIEAHEKTGYGGPARVTPTASPAPSSSSPPASPKLRPAPARPAPTTLAGKIFSALEGVDARKALSLPGEAASSAAAALEAAAEYRNTDTALKAFDRIEGGLAADSKPSLETTIFSAIRDKTGRPNIKQTKRGPVVKGVGRKPAKGSAGPQDAANKKARRKRTPDTVEVNPDKALKQQKAGKGPWRKTKGGKTRPATTTYGAPTVRQFVRAAGKGNLRTTGKGKLATTGQLKSRQDLKTVESRIKKFSQKGPKEILSQLAPEERFPAQLAAKYGKKYNVEPALLMSLMRQESGFQPINVSSAQADGLTQFIPGTAKAYGVEYGDSERAQNTQVEGAAKYLTDLGVQQDPRAALTSYTGGYSDAQYNDPVLQGAGDYKIVNELSGKPPVPKKLRQRYKAVQDTAIRRGVPFQGATEGDPGRQRYKGPRSTKPLLWVQPTNPKRKKGILLDESGGQLDPAQSDIKRLGATISKRTGDPLTIISALRPGSTTTTGNVSDHASGNALDIHALSTRYGSAADQAKGDRIAYETVLAAGGDKATAQRLVDGSEVESFTSPNGHRVQVLWKTDQGGDHHNHVHVGIDEGAGEKVFTETGPIAQGTLSSSPGGSALTGYQPGGTGGTAGTPAGQLAGTPAEQQAAQQARSEASSYSGSIASSNLPEAYVSLIMGGGQAPESDVLDEFLK